MSRAVPYADAAPVSFWLDDPDAPAPNPPLVGKEEADLAVVGGGYTGLWTALLTKASRPDLDVILVEADRSGWAASGRNGGFCAASLTHGLSNGIERFPREIDILERLGRQNLDAIESAVKTWSIECDFERTGDMSVATEPYQAEVLAAAAHVARHHGRSLSLLDGAQVRAEVNSPTYLAGLWDRDGCAMLNPARLAWGLRRACATSGVRIYEGSPVERLRHRDRVPRIPDGAGYRPRSGADTAGGPGHQRLSLAGPTSASLCRSGLRLRADDRAVDGKSAGRDRLGTPPGGGRVRQPVPLLPAEQRPSDPLWGVRRRLPLREPDASRRSSSESPPSPDWPISSPPPSRHWPTSGSPTRGRAPSTPALASVRSSTGRTTVGWRRPVATPGWAWALRASAPR